MLPRVGRQTRAVLMLISAFALVNGLAALSYMPSDHAADVGERVANSRLHPMIAGGAWAAGSLRSS